MVEKKRFVIYIFETKMICDCKNTTDVEQVSNDSSSVTPNAVVVAAFCSSD